MAPSTDTPTTDISAFHERTDSADADDLAMPEKQALGDGSVDVASRLVDNMIAGNVSPEQDRACLRRIDVFLMPVMFLSFALQYMDKACLTGAALFGILSDLDLISLWVFLFLLFFFREFNVFATFFWAGLSLLFERWAGFFWLMMVISTVKYKMDIS